MAFWQNWRVIEIGKGNNSRGESVSIRLMYFAGLTSNSSYSTTTSLKLGCVSVYLIHLRLLIKAQYDTVCFFLSVVSGTNCLGPIAFVGWRVLGLSSTRGMIYNLVCHLFVPSFCLWLSFAEGASTFFPWRTHCVCVWNVAVCDDPFLGPIQPLLVRILWNYNDPSDCYTTTCEGQHHHNLTFWLPLWCVKN